MSFPQHFYFHRIEHLIYNSKALNVKQKTDKFNYIKLKDKIVSLI